jgi:kynurenine formamidase
MKMPTASRFAGALVLSVVVPALSSHSHAQEWIDLSHALSPDAVFWPTAQRFEMRTDFEGHTEGGYYYSAYTFTTAEHGGTHIDAPVHFAEGTRSVDEIPLEQLIGDAVVIDLSDQVRGNCEYRATTSDIIAWEKKHGAIPGHSIVLLHTGFGRFWPNARQYLGTDLRGEAGVAELCFPGLHPEAASWLATERHIKAVGIDTASIDFGGSKDFAAHVNLMTRNIPAFENLANLHKLPPTGAYVVALPAKIQGGSGGPLRIIARTRSGT